MIAPYRAQINYLKDAIEDSAVLNDLLLQRRLSVGTVDSFQGQERDIIAITWTRSNPQGEIGLTTRPARRPINGLIGCQLISPSGNESDRLL